MLHKTEELTNKIDGNNLIFTTLSTGETIDFTGKNDPLTLLKKIRDGKMTIEREKELQEDLNNSIKKLRKGNKTQEHWLLKLKKMAAEEQTEQKGEGLKIFTPKKLF